MGIQTTTASASPASPQWYAIDAALDHLDLVLLSGYTVRRDGPMSYYLRWAASAVHSIEMTAAALDSTTRGVMEAEVAMLRNPVPYSRRNWYSALDAVSCLSLYPPLRQLLCDQRRDRLTATMGQGVWAAVLAAVIQGMRRGGDLEW